MENELFDCKFCALFIRFVGLGVENIGGGGMGPISDNGIGGSGNSDRTIWFWFWWLSGLTFVLCSHPGWQLPYKIQQKFHML